MPRQTIYSLITIQLPTNWIWLRTWLFEKFEELLINFFWRIAIFEQSVYIHVSFLTTNYNFCPEKCQACASPPPEMPPLPGLPNVPGTVRPPELPPMTFLAAAAAREPGRRRVGRFFSAFFSLENWPQLTFTLRFRSQVLWNQIVIGQAVNEWTFNLLWESATNVHKRRLNWWKVDYKLDPTLYELH